MKKAIVCIALLLIWAGVIAQPTFNLELERSVKDSMLTLELYIKKTGGADFALGGSNFDLKAPSIGLDQTKAKFIPGEFDYSKDPSSYESMGIGNGNVMVMNVLVNVKGTGSGKLVTTQRAKVGTIQIPIVNACVSVAPQWVVGRADIQSFFRTATGPVLTEGASYINPEPIDLDNGVSKTIPVITSQKGVLTSSATSHNQWFLDGIVIPNATGQTWTPSVPGKYTVEVQYPCAKNVSQPFAVTVTGLSDFQMSYSFGAQPNPFIGESIISYNLPNASNVRLQLCDLSGTHLLDLESGMKPQGKNDVAFKPSSFNLAAGTYVVKLTVGDKVGTLKLVALR